MDPDLVLPAVSWVRTGLLALLLISSPAAALAGNDGTGAHIYDIPAQPLRQALKTFAENTSLQIFYETSLTAGRWSSPVTGLHDAETALRLLLAGTGLSAGSFESGTVTILETAPHADVRLRQAKARAAGYTRYFALMQAGVQTALCAAPLVRHDAPERRVQLWIAPSGSLAQARLLTPSASRDDDEAFMAALRNLVVAEPPPASMPEPVTMLIMPRAEDAAGCR